MSRKSYLLSCPCLGRHPVFAEILSYQDLLLIYLLRLILDPSRKILADLPECSDPLLLVRLSWLDFQFGDRNQGRFPKPRQIASLIALLSMPFVLQSLFYQYSSLIPSTMSRQIGSITFSLLFISWVRYSSLERLVAVLPRDTIARLKKLVSFPTTSNMYDTHVTVLLICSSRSPSLM